MSIDTDFIVVRNEVETVLAQLDPAHETEWRSDIERRFSAWSAAPAFAIECGVLKLTAEFYVRAVPSRLREGFIKSRNVVLDYLNTEFGARPDIKRIDAARWADAVAFLRREFPE